MGLFTNHLPSILHPCAFGNGIFFHEGILWIFATPGFLDACVQCNDLEASLQLFEVLNLAKSDSWPFPTVQLCKRHWVKLKPRKKRMVLYSWCFFSDKGRHETRFPIFSVFGRFSFHHVLSKNLRTKSWTLSVGGSKRWPSHQWAVVIWERFRMTLVATPAGLLPCWFTASWFFSKSLPGDETTGLCWCGQLQHHLEGEQTETTSTMLLQTSNHNINNIYIYQSN